MSFLDCVRLIRPGKKLRVLDIYSHQILYVGDCPTMSSFFFHMARACREKSAGLVEQRLSELVALMKRSEQHGRVWGFSFVHLCFVTHVR